ncbi:sigma-54-dependent Fis family transcriptional regulator [Phreatobacter aquaticus]|uniref:Sigma-54-dependent Fis family transcriptional regulator n=1 Tax=Phreatobacter aquaticus TaxID=2570229 RepID=A0A4D7QLF8_9HYPH|nr:sigma-54 dependent transcriptional regulator [Phreatobacter aquaticus]QCK85997.1 sigma-54-dependent Fis family transcriptional regulator [Phreatobacter aquaticus]
MGSQEPAHDRLRHFLIVDADPAARRLMASSLVGLGACQQAGDTDQALAALDRHWPDAVIACLDTGRLASPAIIEAIRLAGFEGPILATSAIGSMTSAVEAMRAGATDMLIKPVAATDLIRRLETHLADQPAAQPVPRRTEAASDRDFERFIGSSPAMAEVYDQIRRIAPSRAPVFVTGESGTGKEVTAQALHDRSGREASRFVALNCGAIPKDLIESEIFGHVKGAFTGATEDRTGAAELADGGTLFLDEICEMDLALQTKLLRFIQTGEVRRVGDTRIRQVDVRFVCATNRDPLADVAAGRFREDLYYRLCVLPIHLPPLRERGEDVLALARAFLARFAEEEGRHFHGFDIAAEKIIQAFPWPGNVRQLQNVMRRLVVMHDGDWVTAPMLPLALAHGSYESATERAAVQPIALTRGTVEPYWVQERRIIEEALAAFDGNLSRAAAALEISPSTIYRKREAWAKDPMLKAG